MMTSLLSSAWVQVPADTVVLVNARDGHDLIVAIAAGMIAATFLAVLFGLLFLFYQARQAVQAVEKMRVNLLNDPSVDSARAIVGHAEAISKVARDEVTDLTQALGTASDRIRQASDRMEERIEEFNALMEVVQDEAEGVFIDTAATARGLRKGMTRLGDPRPARRPRTVPLPEPAEKRPTTVAEPRADGPPDPSPPPDLSSPGHPSPSKSVHVPGKLPSPGEGAATTGTTPSDQDPDAPGSEK